MPVAVSYFRFGEIAMQPRQQLLYVGLGVAAIVIAAIVLSGQHLRMAPRSPDVPTASAAPSSELCALITDGQASLAQLSQQVGAESNPLRQATRRRNMPSD